MKTQAADGEVLAALDRVRDRVLARPDLTLALSRERDPAAFAGRLAGIAEALGAGLSAEAVASLLALPPMGPSALPMPAKSCAGGGPSGWRPANMDLMTGGLEWAHVGEARADGGFYYDEVHRAQRRPFNRLFRFASPLAELTAAPPPDALSPSGIVFHMSYCGSTLVSRMLAAAGAHLSLGEPQPLDAALRLCAGGLDAEVQVRLLRGIVAELGRPRRAETHYFLKLDTWHIGLLPLIRRAFPAANWVFVYRDPLEVLEAQVQTHCLDAARMHFRLLGIEWDGGTPSGAPIYAAALAAMCEAALAAASERAGGLLVNYAELPAAVGARILPHFGVRPTAAEIAAMSRVARYHAKRPAQSFVADSAARRAVASAETRKAVEGRLADAYARLETARLRSSSPL